MQLYPQLKVTSLERLISMFNTRVAITSPDIFQFRPETCLQCMWTVRNNMEFSRMFSKPLSTFWPRTFTAIYCNYLTTDNNDHWFIQHTCTLISFCVYFCPIFLTFFYDSITPTDNSNAISCCSLCQCYTLTWNEPLTHIVK